MISTHDVRILYFNISFLILSFDEHLTNLLRSRYLIVAGYLRMIALGVMLLLVAHLLKSEPYTAAKPIMVMV